MDATTISISTPLHVRAITALAASLAIVTIFLLIGAQAAHAQSTENTAVGECAPYLSDFIRFGADNDRLQVMKLQHFLRYEEGFGSVTIHGVYDDMTRDAVISFQERYAEDILRPWGIDAGTGFVYLTTRKKINEIRCHGAREFALTEAQVAEIAAARFQPALKEVVPSEKEMTDTSDTSRMEEVVELESGSAIEPRDENGSATTLLQPSEERSGVLTVEESGGDGRSTSATESSLGRFFRGVGDLVGSVLRAVF